tara:strand:- start:349 stop:1008 length:660 start_codon:yes stop_codon:yes gene_type:complete
MLYSAHKLINEEEAKDFKERLIASTDWVDGKETALGRAKDIKRNLQLSNGDSYKIFSQEIINILNNDNTFQVYTMPKKIFSILFSRTGVGGFYGPHCDFPYNPNGRRDLSFTLFLNQPSEYEGGELILNIPPMKKTVKLNAGEIVIYPTKYLHEVTKVQKGERIVCVGWIHSQISNDMDRQTLLSLRLGLGELKQIKATQSIYNRFNLVYMNLYKRFLD